MTKSCSLKRCSAINERSTSIKRLALRFDCNNRLPIHVFVVAKKMRDGLRMLAGAELRAGCDMAGAKARVLSNAIICGPAEAVPLLQNSFRCRHDKSHALLQSASSISPFAPPPFQEVDEWPH